MKTSVRIAADLTVAGHRRGRGHQASHQAQDLPAHSPSQSLAEPLVISIALSEIAFTC
jgi:hypothetical protein